MEKPVIVLKPSIVNALLPTFARNFFYAFIVGLIVLGLFYLLKLLNITGYSLGKMILWILPVMFLVSLAPLAFSVIVLHSTKYYFYRTHVIREFQFIKIERYSVPYSQIVQVTVDVSFWDRLCKAGDITLHTAEEKAPNVILHFVKKPHDVERHIHELIERSKAPAHHV